MANLPEIRPWLAEEVARPPAVQVERARDDADEGNGRLERVADRRLAARRVPAVEAPRREANAGDAVLAAIDESAAGAT
ncbi:MAG: hypothetical protein JOZ69_07585 [Myxococcales bacterium]|nr:hypothetical protein [Myxococcales bacterium]